MEGDLSALSPGHSGGLRPQETGPGPLYPDLPGGGFFCNWCIYAGADLAGVSRLQYPPNLRVIRVMCSGTVSPHHVRRAFQKGADGVLIGGCHHLRGNYMTIKRMRFLQEFLKFIGREDGRLHLEWISAAEGPKFAQTVREFTAKIKKWALHAGSKPPGGVTPKPDQEMRISAQG
jgi:F420-non-reducing hydrogenase iron-sulfur subunit